MREKTALYLLILALFLIVAIDAVPLATGEPRATISYIESIVDASVVVLIYLTMKGELNFRTKVINMAAHDLRSPLGIIRGYSEIILEKSTTAEAELDMVRRIHIKADELLQLVDDLLDSAVLERRQVTMVKEHCSLKSMVSVVASDLEEAAKRKNQRFTFHAVEDLKVHTDAARMKQVFQNLLSNAVKYSPQGSEVAIHIEREGDLARVKVKDEGPGLSKSELPLVFDSFTKIKKVTTGGESSTGLGLSICKSLVELNGGKIWAESAGQGKGSTFIVELPTV